MYSAYVNILHSVFLYTYMYDKRLLAESGPVDISLILLQFLHTTLRVVI